MIVKTVSKAFSKKADLGNYSSIEIGCTVWADTNGENLDECNHNLWAFVVNNVHAQLADFVREEAPGAVVFTNGTIESGKANIKTLSVFVKRTLKTDPKDYGMLKAEDSAWADVEEMDDVTECANQLFAMTRENVKSQLAPHVKPLQRVAKEFYLGLPVEVSEDK